MGKSIRSSRGTWRVLDHLEAEAAADAGSDDSFWIPWTKSSRPSPPLRPGAWSGAILGTCRPRFVPQAAQLYESRGGGSWGSIGNEGACLQNSPVWRGESKAVRAGHPPFDMGNRMAA